MDGLSPREIIAQLDVDEIDQAIDDLKEELSALQSLRKVALAKNGRAPAANRGSNRPASGATAERIETAIEVLQKWGPLPLAKLAERSGCTPRGVRWFLKAIKADSRFLVKTDPGETVNLT